MKKKLIIMLSIVAVLACLFAITAFAADPDNNGKTVTLSDGTVCALYDTEGNPLLWYITSTDADTGAKTYAHIAANDEAVDRYNGWSGGDQLGSMKITVNGTDYGNSSFVVLNLYDVTISRGQRVGNKVTYFSKTFTSASNLEYVFAPLGTTGFGSEDFKNCPNLRYINIEELTELTSVGSQSFNGCSKLFAGQKLDLSNTKLVSTAGNAFATVAATEFVFPTTFTSLGQETFKDCKNVTKITFLGEVTTIANGAYATFRNCENLETVTGTAKAFEANKHTHIGYEAFRNCKKLKQVDGLIENGILTIPEGVQTVNAFAFSYCQAITYIDLPSTLTTVNQQGFSYMSNVKLIDFGKITGALSLGNCGNFRDMDSLIAVSLPEGMTDVKNRAFASCDNLTAFYMPNSIQTLNTNGDGQGSFCGSQKLYFVQESFSVSQCLVDGVVDTSKLVLPSKPEVYYMPTSLTAFSGTVSSGDKYAIASIFRYCYALNDVIVFPEGFKSAMVTRAFQEIGTKDSPKTIVFTGDIEEFAITHYSQYITFIFANKNDKDFNDLGVIRSTGNSKETGSSAYFCSTGVRYDLAISGRVGSSQDYSEADIANIATTIAAIHATGVADESCHIRDKRKDETTLPTCTENSVSNTYCFCGFKIGSVVNKDTALGHDDTDAVVIMYFANNNYFENATSEYTCKRCEEAIKSEIDNSALFTKKGITVPENEKTTSICHAIAVNNKAIENYNAYLGESNAIKYGVVVGKATASGKPVNTDGTSSGNAIVVGFDGTDYSHIQAKITNVPDNTGLYCSAYVIDAGVVTYLYEGSASTTAQVISLSNYNPTLPETTVSSNDEE
ncbi:MAG: leucine-rich repeat protein [Clostridia bacterium]|nr:leucine-rich repeat protein [Clostridia bacterium]